MNLNPLSKFRSPYISILYGKGPFPVRELFVVQSAEHWRAWDHLRYTDLGIIFITFSSPDSD